MGNFIKARDGFKSNVPAVTGRRPFRNPVNDVLKSSFQTGVFDPDGYVGEILFLRLYSLGLFAGHSANVLLKSCFMLILFFSFFPFFFFFFFFRLMTKDFLKVA